MQQKYGSIINCVERISKKKYGDKCPDLELRKERRPYHQVQSPK